MVERVVCVYTRPMFDRVSAEQITVMPIFTNIESRGPPCGAHRACPPLLVSSFHDSHYSTIRVLSHSNTMEIR